MPDYEILLAELDSSFSAEVDSTNLPNASPDVLNDGQRFSELLSVGDSVAPVNESLPPIQRSGIYTNTLGDAILQRLDALGSSFRAQVERTHAMVEATPNSLSLRDLVKLQLEMASVSLEIEIVGKGVQKAVQHADQLSKIQ